MKELTIEEKAKRYDEAIKIARKIKGGESIDTPDGTVIPVAVFPELKEDEDELTWLKNYISEEVHYLSMDIRNYEDRLKLQKLQKSLAWLEKQTESDEIKARIFLINKGYPIDTNGTFPTYEEMYNIIREGFEKQDEQKLVEWSEKDEHKVKDIIYFLNSAKVHYASDIELNGCIKWLWSLLQRMGFKKK